VDVAELMPEVATAEGLSIRSLEVVAPCERLEHRKVASARLVETGE
jgi:hypothetical protein